MTPLAYALLALAVAVLGMVWVLFRSASADLRAEENEAEPVIDFDLLEAEISMDEHRARRGA